MGFYFYNFNGLRQNNASNIDLKTLTFLLTNLTYGSIQWRIFNIFRWELYAY